MLLQLRAQVFHALGRGSPHRVLWIGRNRQVLQAAHRGDEPAQLRGCVDGLDLWKSTPYFGCCVRHCGVHTCSSSSVVVIVASSDSVLSMTAVPYSAGTPATASRGTMTREAALTASMTRLGIAMFSETPTTTMVDTSRFRSTASRSVPPIGPTPCQRLKTRSVGSGPNSGNTAAPGGPGVTSTPPRPTAKILALWLEPSPSGRRWTKQCTMRTPA